MPNLFIGFGKQAEDEFLRLYVSTDLPTG